MNTLYLQVDTTLTSATDAGVRLGAQAFPAMWFVLAGIIAAYGSLAAYAMLVGRDRGLHKVITPAVAALSIACFVAAFSASADSDLRTVNERYGTQLTVLPDRWEPVVPTTDAQGNDAVAVFLGNHRVVVVPAGEQ